MSGVLVASVFAAATASAIVTAAVTTAILQARFSIRFDERLLERLRRRAQGASPCGLGNRLVDEGLRMAEHPEVVFKHGPTGRRAAVAFGPDVWEVVKFLREVEQRGSEAVAATAEMLRLTGSQVRIAMHYHSAYPDEIDDEITQADEESRAAEAAWQTEQRRLRRTAT
jgi:hypothetical protein